MMFDHHAIKIDASDIVCAYGEMENEGFSSRTCTCLNTHWKGREMRCHRTEEAFMSAVWSVGRRDEPRHMYHHNSCV